MKADAISRRELPRLIRHLQEHREFSGTRGGRSVRIVLDPVPLIRDAPPILFSVKVGAAWVSGRTQTVYAASDEINRLAKGGRA